jgi:hypothetical protein
MTLCKLCGISEVPPKTAKGGRQRIYCDVCCKSSNNTYILKKREFLKTVKCQQCQLPMPDYVKRIRVYCPECAAIRQREARIRNMKKVKL